MTILRKLKHRTEEELRDALSRFIHRKSVMSIPVDLERDADIILSDGISELIELRKRRFCICEFQSFPECTICGRRVTK